MLKLEEIKQLIKEIDESSINEFTYEKDELKLKIKKADVNADPVHQIIQQMPETVHTPAVPQTNQMETIQEVPANQTEIPAEEAGIQEIVSPMVGTFYRKPSPESDNYVSVGDQINESSIVCIVEAMKLFNEIEAELSGEITEVLVEDGELVEFGQPLFKVKTN